MYIYYNNSKIIIFTSRGVVYLILSEGGIWPGEGARLAGTCIAARADVINWKNKTRTKQHKIDIFIYISVD